MLDRRNPLRQFQFIAVVHHRLGVFNRTVPPFIAALLEMSDSARKVQAPAIPSLQADDNAPPAFDNDSDSDANGSMNDVTNRTVS